MLNGEGYHRRQNEMTNHRQRPLVFTQVEGRRDIKTIRTQAVERQQNNSGTGQQQRSVENLIEDTAAKQTVGVEEILNEPAEQLGETEERFNRPIDKEGITHNEAGSAHNEAGCTLTNEAGSVQ